MKRGALCFLFALAACRSGSDTSNTTPTAASASAKPAAEKPATHDATVIDFAKADDCTFGHRGILLDLGDPSMRARMSGEKLAPPDVEFKEHEGASWVSVRSRSLDLSFVSAVETKADAGVVIEARGRGGIAKSASVYLNGHPIGSLSFTKRETAILSTHAQGTIQRGQNDLLIRFNGGGKQQHDALAELDWIRVGAYDGDAPYSAPTRNDALTTVTINNSARRSVSLRAPGFDRCTAYVPSNSTLEGFIGVTGGEAEAEVRVLADHAEPRVVGSFHLGGPTDPPGWRPMALPLGDVGTIAAIELVAKTSTKGARVAFGEAHVTAPQVNPPPPPSADAIKPRGVVLVTMGSESRRLLAQYGGTIALPELDALANGGTIFESHRATSSWATGAMGSMLTGLGPREHGASDPDAALAPSVTLIEEAARQAGIMTAMFTANPTTAAAFGFNRGWETFQSHFPTEDGPATTVFDDAAKWIETHKDDRFLVVIHARGGHPPWDVTTDELKDMPPTGYQGGLDPKHAGEGLAKSKKIGNGRLSDPDRERAFALHGKALTQHDAALGALAQKVKSLGRDKDTVWIVTSDVGLDAAARVPFLEEESLDEGALAIPLMIKTPQAAARARVDTATSSADVAPTILEALALTPPPNLKGASLLPVPAQPTMLGERVLVAISGGHFSARWGSFAIVGARDHETKVCNLTLDAECVSDVRASHPIATEALHTLAWRDVLKVDQKSDEVLSPHANPDQPTAAALHAWGR